MRNEFPTKKMTPHNKKIRGNFEHENLGDCSVQLWGIYQTPRWKQKNPQVPGVLIWNPWGLQVTPLFIAPYDGSREFEAPQMSRSIAAFQTALRNEGLGFWFFNFQRWQICRDRFFGG